MSANENQIVVYHPNETVRLDVRLENETVWLTQSQMGELFGCTTRNVSMHLDNIYSCGELAPEGTRKDFFLVRLEGSVVRQPPRDEEDHRRRVLRAVRRNHAGTDPVGFHA